MAGNQVKQIYLIETYKQERIWTSLLKSRPALIFDFGWHLKHMGLRDKGFCHFVSRKYTQMIIAFDIGKGMNQVEFAGCPLRIPDLTFLS